MGDDCKERCSNAEPTCNDPATPEAQPETPAETPADQPAEDTAGE